MCLKMSLDFKVEKEDLSETEYNLKVSCEEFTLEFYPYCDEKYMDFNHWLFMFALVCRSKCKNRMRAWLRAGMRFEQTVWRKIAVLVENGMQEWNYGSLIDLIDKLWSVCGVLEQRAHASYSASTPISRYMRNSIFWENVQHRMDRRYTL